MEHVEPIVWKGRALAYVVRAELSPERTTFTTPEEFNLQIGYVVYPAGGTIPPHIHLPLTRHIVGTSEVLIVKTGRCLVDFFSEEKEPVATRELRAGDIMLLVAGGHGFRMLEDTVLLEVKQGPYTGLEEKQRF